MKENPSFELGTFNRLRDLSSQRELFLDAFPEQKGKAPESISHYEWKFNTLQNPLRPPSNEYVARYGEVVVGYYAALPYRYKIHGEIYEAGMVCDVMTHSTQRGKGLFYRLGRVALSDLSKANVDFTTGYPVREEVLPGHLKVGWQVGFVLPVYLRLFRVNSLFKKFHISFLSSFGNCLLGFLNSIRSLVFFRKNKEFYAQAIDLKSFIEAPQRVKLSRELAQGVPCFLIKDESFLSWRLSAPGTKYLAFVLKDEKDAWLGWAIGCHSELKGIKVLSLLDFSLKESAILKQDKLQKVLQEECRKNDLDGIAFMMSTYRYRSLKLWRYVYFKTPAIFRFIFNNLSKKVPDELFFSESLWNLMWIDSDDL